MDTSVGYVNQVLQRLKDEGGVEQPRDGRWQVTGAEPAKIKAEPGANLDWDRERNGVRKAKPSPGTFFVFRGPDGSTVFYLEVSLHVPGVIETSGDVVQSAPQPAGVAP